MSMPAVEAVCTAERDPVSGRLTFLPDVIGRRLTELQTKFNAQTAAVQGSGWGWLVSSTYIVTLCVTEPHRVVS